jgi:hypothetical protein
MSSPQQQKMPSYNELLELVRKQRELYGDCLEKVAKILAAGKHPDLAQAVMRQRELYGLGEYHVLPVVGRQRQSELLDATECSDLILDVLRHSNIGMTPKEIRARIGGVISDHVWTEARKFLLDRHLIRLGGPGGPRVVYQLVVHQKAAV